MTTNLPEKASEKKKPERDPEARMTFTAHLGELRIRMIRSIIAILVGFFICYAFSEKIVEALSMPLRAPSDVAPPQEPAPGSDEPAKPRTQQGRGVQWVILTPIEAFMVKMKTSAYAGLVLATPIVAYQVCAFVFPGLTATEKRMVRVLLFGGLTLAVAGVGAAYFFILPLALNAVLGWAPSFAGITLSVGSTLSIIIKALLAFGLAFQMPMVVLVLVYLGLLTPASLKAYRKIAIVSIFVVVAVFTPPDPISMLLMAIPLVLLYEFSILVSHLVVRQKAKAAAAAGA